MRTSIGELVPVLVAGLAACDHDAWEMDRMREAIDDARVENGRHRDLARYAPDVPTITADVEYHDGLMHQSMGSMDDTMDGMGRHCDDRAMDSMDTALSAMDAEMADHRVALETVGTLDEARAACERHYLQLDALLDSMDASIGDFGCM